MIENHNEPFYEVHNTILKIKNKQEIKIMLNDITDSYTENEIGQKKESNFVFTNESSKYLLKIKGACLKISLIEINNENGINNCRTTLFKFQKNLVHNIIYQKIKQEKVFLKRKKKKLF